MLKTLKLIQRHKRRCTVCPWPTTPTNANARRSLVVARLALPVKAFVDERAPWTRPRLLVLLLLSPVICLQILLLIHTQVRCTVRLTRRHLHVRP